MAPVWLYYMVRSGSVWFFTPSNPKLTFGGMEGEPKKEMHELLPEKWRARYFNVPPGMDFSDVQEGIVSKQIGYPLIVKPEVGSKGILMRKIADAEQLKYYHDHVKVEYLVQQFVSFPLEVSMFYYRYPWEKKGKITGFLQKVPMRVTGDGVHTLQDLILSNSKSRKRMEEIQARFGDDFNKILNKGEIYHLSFAGNHNRGASFIDLKDEIDDRLLEIPDSISLSINDFFYGRYDILCNSIEELKERKNFVILEYNGCGAEPNHFYDTGFTLRRAYLEIMMHWKKLYTISRYNHLHGYKYWSFIKGYKFWRESYRHLKTIEEIDKQIP